MKSLEVDLPIYSPPGLLIPSAEAVMDFDGMSPLDVAILLSRAAVSHKWKYDPDIYRAGTAEQVKAGNCLAVAELVMGTCTAIEYSSFLLWNGEHARALMDDGVDIWEINDGTYEK